MIHREDKMECKMGGSKSVPTDNCTTHFFFCGPTCTFGKGTFCVQLYGSDWWHLTATTPSINSSSPWVCQRPALRGLGTAMLLLIGGRKGYKSILLQQQLNQVVQAPAESSFVSSIHYSFIWHTKDCHLLYEINWGRNHTHQSSSLWHWDRHSFRTCRSCLITQRMAFPAEATKAVGRRMVQGISQQG